MLVHWMNIGPDANYQFLEFYSGSGRITKLAGFVGYESVAFDIQYGELLANQHMKRSAMDINSNAGMTLLDWTNQSSFFIRMYG